MTATQTPEHCDVAIVGLGPVGLFAAILLGRRGHRVIALDRFATPYPRPRAVTFDHEIARLLNSIGVNADSDTAIDYYDAIYRWRNATGDVLMDVDWASRGVDGWRNRYWFSQPVLEERLRQIAESLPGVELKQGHRVESVDQDESGVTLQYRASTPGGEARTIRAAMTIGSDGANSTVREQLGLVMTDLKFHYDWLVVDILPTEELAYELPHFQICDPVRPTTVVPGGPGRTPGAPPRRRWEFMALPGETAAELEDPVKVWELLAPFGVTPANAELERAVFWRFQAKYLEQWNIGRVALAGDAAHLMPPFAGEGMCAGLRDVANLCWRIDLVLRDLVPLTSLDGYTSERKTNVQWYIDFAIMMGRTICVTDPREAMERDQRMTAEHLTQDGPIHAHLATLGPGAWVADDPHAGRPAIEGRVAYRGRFGRFDDVAGAGWNLLSTVDQGDPLEADQRAAFERIGGRTFTVGPPGSGAEVIDIDGRYADWFAENGVRHLLVRPDFCVAATAADRAGLRGGMEQVLGAIGLAGTDALAAP
ncbi:3-(3-hydroxy-phenyl)propionate hydroxylase [Propionibacteriaceae bacterium ES.041]|uniref:bifunctional 3-(3-hydroxy-phenyl)propionate/3-hydroxycinnamic acid hydroxylase MhpA n=1 Tax=Enemella evansiae TaxID=2016499 RepID=UPI000B976D43|nr:bifunctional 3-(3-hydroxy-phenyl)propionate/3-hydroxycinnamic acid hydroxylase [Enemella evansiae]OYN96399.1 3-(3-hydroxyphenyl)propionate hydroxylase [Enemella evansiae]PFG65654.1 3-(3-hydroxy-phenyl)propionate hydroxylase [Propionibacteriaceae bacterium ES.041]